MVRRTYVLTLLLLTFGGLILGCSSKANDPAKVNAGKPAVAVEVAKAAPSDITEGVEVVGALSPKVQANVRPEFQGTVTHVYVAEWVRVRKGTPLAELDTREMQLMLQKSQAAVEGAKASVMQAEVARNRAEREYDRLVKLKEAGLVTQQNLEDGRTEKEASGARLSAAQAQLRAVQDENSQVQVRLSKAVLRSPMDGVVSQKNVNVGDMVGDPAGNKVLFNIVDNRRLELTVTVPSREMGGLRVGQPLTFSTDAIPGKTFTGKVAFINPAVNEADRSVRVVAEVRNDSEELKTGLFVKGRIVTGTRTGVLQVPRTSLLTWNVLEKKADVFVARSDKVQRVPVKTGSISLDLVEVSSGLAAGDLVVTRGGFSLKDGDPVKVIQGSGR